MHNKMIALVALLVGIAMVACQPQNTEVVDPGENQVESEQSTSETEAEPVDEADGSDESMSASGGQELPEVDPFSVSGNITLAGSSTVFPLVERMAERFQDEGFDGNVTIDTIGSGAGFERFCVAGESDISNASRPIKDSEVESCQSIGRDPIEFRVGTDALAVVVSSDNEFLSELTLEQLATAWSTADTWADVDPSFPAEEILRYSPGTDSGTFDYFIEEIFDKEEEPLFAASNLELSEVDNVLVQGILGSPEAISYFGYAYYQENADSLNILSIDGVETVQENVETAVIH